MIGSMTRELYDYTCTGIFERHKLMFSFQLTTSIMEGDGELNRCEDVAPQSRCSPVACAQLI